MASTKELAPSTKRVKPWLGSVKRARPGHGEPLPSEPNSGSRSPKVTWSVRVAP